MLTVFTCNLFVIYKVIIKQVQYKKIYTSELQVINLMPSDISTMEISTKVFKLVVEIPEAIGSEKSVTISTIRPLLYDYYNEKELIEDPSDKPLAKPLKCVMLTYRTDRYNSKEYLLNKTIGWILVARQRNIIINMVGEEASEIAI